MHLLFPLAWRNLWQHRLRTMLSILAVALGTATIIAADVTGSAIRNAGQAIDASGGTVAFAGDLINTGLNTVGLVILIATAFLIFNAFAMAVTQRRQQIGALRSLGMTRGQVIRLVLLEALLIGGAGTLFGLLSGPLLGRGLVILLARLMGVSYGLVSLTGPSLLRAAALGIGATLLATLLPAGRAARVAPLAALRTQEVADIEGPQKKRAALGLLLITLQAIYLLLKPPGATLLTPPWDFVLTGLFALGWLAGLALTLPFLIGTVSNGVGRLAGRWFPSSRLTADNLARARGRVILTIITLIIGLMTIVGVTGITHFSFEVVINQVVAQYDMEWIVGPLPQPADGTAVNWEILSRWDLSTWTLSPGFLAQLAELTDGRARLVHVPEVEIPELALMKGLPVFVADPEELRHSGLFTFTEGNWASARPIMESGCGLMLLPRTARKLDVELYGAITLKGVNGPVECTVAGLGMSAFMGTPIISRAAGDAFGLKPDHYFLVIVLPLPGEDRAALRTELDTLLAQYVDYSLIEVEPFFENASDMLDSLQVLLNGMLLLAILAAAFGVINTTMISVSERRHELGLLRAVGATRRQVTAIVTGEAALMGLVGGGLGWIAGIGLTAIYVAVNGGHMWGLGELPLWSSAWAAIRPAILNGISGIIAAPFICAGAAWLPTRSLLHHLVIEMTHQR